MHRISFNLAIRIAIVMFSLTFASCKQFKHNTENNTIPLRESYQKIEHDSLLQALQRFNPSLHLNLSENKRLKEFPNTLFIYISDAHCYSCVEIILQEVQSFLLYNNSKSISIIYSTAYRNNFYSFKKAYPSDIFNFFLLERKDALQEEFKFAFFFELDNKSQVTSVFIPEISNHIIAEYLTTKTREKLKQ